MPSYDYRIHQCWSSVVAKTSFGQWLKQRRLAIDLTHEDLAGRIGCAIITLYKIEANERRPSKPIATLLATHLNIPPTEHEAFVRFARADDANAAIPWGTPFHPLPLLPMVPTASPILIPTLITSCSLRCPLQLQVLLATNLVRRM